MANRLTNRRGRPTPKARSKTVIVSVFACKLKALTNSRGSYPLADMETSNNTHDQVHSIFDCRNDSINSTCTYDIVNERYYNNHTHIITTCFLAAASNKCVRLLTSLYGICSSNTSTQSGATKLTNVKSRGNDVHDLIYVIYCARDKCGCTNKQTQKT